MILSGSMFFWLFQCALCVLGNAENAHPVRGIPGVDYPNFETIPQTSFRCSEQLHIPGLYADPETGCQMFHHCYEHRHESFLCPPGTIFNQAILACDYWYSSECSETTFHTRTESQHKVFSFDHETEFVPNKNPSVNVFDKMASLYELKDPVPTSSKKYRSDTYSPEESGQFTGGHILGMHTNMDENQKYVNSYSEVANLHDRREGVLIESPGEEGNNNENDLRILKDSFADFESSGESEGLDEHEFGTDNLVLINDTEEHADFEKHYFAYNEGGHSEHHTKHSNRVKSEEHLLTDSYTDLEDKEKKSSIEDFESVDKFVRRQSESIENPSEKRKTKKRKPIFTIQSEEKLDHFIITEKPKDNIKSSSNVLVDYPASSLKDHVPEFKYVSNPAPTRNKRRKPILIDLEDLPPYNFDNKQNVPGGTRASSINYKVNLDSKIPDFPISAEEISVKLFPSKVKRERKPSNGYLIDIERYNEESDKNIKLSGLNHLESHASNIYDATSTLSPLKDINSYEDVSINLATVYPKRKKNIIHIVDSENDHDDYIENKEFKDSTIYTTESQDEITTQSFKEGLSFDKFSELTINYHDDKNEHEIESDSIAADHYVFIENNEPVDESSYTTEFENEITTHQPLNENFEDLDKFSEPNINDHDDIESDSVEVGTEQYDDSHSFIPPYTHIEESDGADPTYFTEINPEEAFNINKYEDESVLKGEVNSRNLHDIEADLHESMQDFPYVSTEFPISEISTRMPHEIQYVEDTTTQIYFIPNTDVQSTFDYLGSTETIPNSFPETSDKSPVVREYLMNNFQSNPYYQTSVDSTSYKLLDNSNNKDAVTEYSHSENEDLQNVLKQLPSDAYETKHEINHSDFGESNLNASQNNTHVESAIPKEQIEEFDPLFDLELQEYLSNQNSNLENNFDISNFYTEPSVSFVEDSSSKYSLEGQYHTIFDELDTLEAHDPMQDEGELIYQTVPPKLESENNAYLSDDPIQMDTLENIKQESFENKDEFDESSYFEPALSTDFAGSPTESWDELESDHSTTSVYAFETQNIPNYHQEDSLDSKSNININGVVKGASKSGMHNFVSSTETNMLNKGYPNLEQGIAGNMKTEENTKTGESIKTGTSIKTGASIKTGTNIKTGTSIQTGAIIKTGASIKQKSKTEKDELVKRPRAFISRHQMESILFEAFGSQNFADLPYSMLKLKQSSMRKVLPDAMHMYGLEDMAYSTRTGNLLLSPKISKLISIGKNLLRAKKAKLRILGSYSNYFKTDH